MPDYKRRTTEHNRIGWDAGHNKTGQDRENGLPVFVLSEGRIFSPMFLFSKAKTSNNDIRSFA